MTKNSKLRRRYKKEIRKELSNLKKLKLEHPAMFRKCGDKPCCMALTEQGQPCSRPAMTSKTYIKRLKCCYLCWQHSLIYGVYVLFKIAKNIGTMDMEWDDYCSNFPDDCNEYLKLQGEYKLYH